jgi:glycerol kinase
VAPSGGDLIEPARADTGLSPSVIRSDGGMSQNPTFVQALADAAQIIVETSPIAEATTMGAAHLASVAIGRWPSVPATAALWAPALRAEPSDAPERRAERERWHEAIQRSAGWIPELSSLDF